MSRRSYATALFALAAVVSTPALAQYQGIVSLPPVGPGDSRLLLGAAVISRPDYQGSSERTVMVLPLIDYAHKNGFYASTGVGIGYSFINTPQTQVGVRVIPQFGRDADKSAALRGMGDLDWGVEASAYATHYLTRNWVVGANIRGGKHGGELDLGARYDTVIGPSTRMSLFGFTTAGNGTSQQTWFGVNATQALNSGYSVYAPGAGFRNIQGGISFNHFFAGRWFAIGGLSVGQLIGDAADSPIVRDKTHVNGFLALSYQLF